MAVLQRMAREGDVVGLNREFDAALRLFDQTREQVDKDYAIDCRAYLAIATVICRRPLLPLP